jgi:hypothetical protein
MGYAFGFDFLERLRIACIGVTDDSKGSVVVERVCETFCHLPGSVCDDRHARAGHVARITTPARVYRDEISHRSAEHHGVKQRPVGDSVRSVRHLRPPALALTLNELALHPTVKPIAMIADAMKDVSRRSGIVLDLFGGSGSTLIAAHKTGRRARLCELDPIYCDRILRRWEIFAKDEAEHVACGWASRPPSEDPELGRRRAADDAGMIWRTVARRPKRDPEGASGIAASRAIGRARVMGSILLVRNAHAVPRPSRVTGNGERS